ncbi:PPOX class F420-dependent oxidoreductase [Microbacterium sp. P05]|uniref:PPOX class F420-dependent oxidoreductase n=1 Tax=Microbacterium sp. P05 TaxID=3366948 RepID=UPI0037466EB8
MIPDDLRDLLENPNYGALGTVRPDGSVQVNPMWFELDGDRLLFTHTTTRQKFRNLEANPSMSLMVFDPADPYRYIEVRGRLVAATPDTAGDFYVRLGKRYGNPEQQPPPDIANRVVLAMSIERIGRH